MQGTGVEFFLILFPNHIINLLFYSFVCSPVWIYDVNTYKFVDNVVGSTPCTQYMSFLLFINTAVKSSLLSKRKCGKHWPKLCLFAGRILWRKLPQKEESVLQTYQVFCNSCASVLSSDLWPLYMDWTSNALPQQPSLLGCNSAGLHFGVHCNRIC